MYDGITKTINCRCDTLSYFDIFDRNTLIHSKKNSALMRTYSVSYINNIDDNGKTTCDGSSNTIKRIANSDEYHFVVSAHDDTIYNIVNNSGVEFSISGYNFHLVDVYINSYTDPKLVGYLYENMNFLLNQSICRIIVEYCSV